MAEIKRFDHFELSCNEVNTLRFTTSDLSGGAMLTELLNQLTDFVQDNAESKLIVDFSGLSWCPSLLINGMLRVKKIVQRGGGELKLCSMSMDVLQTFQVMNLERVFEIHNSVEDAKATFDA